MPSPLLEIEDLSVEIASPSGGGLAVAGVGLVVRSGEMLALVGESGCGKSMTALALMRLLPAAARIVAGRIRLDGSDISDLSASELEDLRGRRLGMIFQEPMTSLNPVLTIERQTTEGLRRHFGIGEREARRRAEAALESVRIRDPGRVMRQYPHELSGGMRQRVMIAAALALEPRLLIADEPTTALDVTVQAQVLDLLAALRDEGSAVLMVTHDLGVVAETADAVAVMYAGRIVETAPVGELFGNPMHPYTRGLLAAHLTLEDAARPAGAPPPVLATIPGSVPPIGRRPSGCAFRDRCPKAFDRCGQEPPLKARGPVHSVACWRASHD